MDSSAIPDLAKLAARPFQSFAEAADAVLDALAARYPDRTVVLGGLNFDRGEYRVIESRGRAIRDFEPGYTLPIGESLCLHMASDSAPRLCNRTERDPVYGALELSRSRFVRAYVGFPLELTSGARVGSLCVMSAEEGCFGDEDLELLSVAGRMLAYEWERVAQEVELQRLRKHRGDPETTDALTGVTERQSFMTWLVHEWQAAHQGTVESYLVLFDLSGSDRAVERFGGAIGELLLKDAARVLEGQARRTDIVARISGDRLAVVLVDCKGEAGAKAFCERVTRGFEAVSGDRPAEVKLEPQIFELGRLRSADQTLEIVGQPARKFPHPIKAMTGRH